MCSASVRVYFILGCILFLLFSFFFLMLRPPLISTLFPYTTLFRSFFQLRAQRCPHACRRIDLLRQFVGRGNNARSEEHTSKLQSHHDLVCRLLLEKKKEHNRPHIHSRLRRVPSRRKDDYAAEDDTR